MDIQMLIGNINANKALNSNTNKNIAEKDSTGSSKILKNTIISSEPKNTTEKVSSFSKELTKVAEKQNITDDKTTEEEFDSKVYQLVLSFLNGTIDLNQLKDQLKAVEVPKNINFSVYSLMESVSGLKDKLSSLINDFNLVEKLIDTGSDEDNKVYNINDVNNVNKKILTTIIKSLVKDSTKTFESIDTKSENSTLENVINIKLSIENRVSGAPKNEKAEESKVKVKGDDFLTKLLSSVEGNDEKKDFQVSRVINIMDNLKNDFKVNVDNLNELPVINKSAFVSDILKNVKFMSINSMKELTVKIMPKELGEVVIKLVMDGNMLKANIQASNKEAYNLLNSQLSDLTKGLNEVKIQSINISIYQEDTTFFAGQFKDNSRQQQEENKKKSSGTSSLRIEEVSTDASSNYNGNVDILA